jgi:hypothetical protein
VNRHPHPEPADEDALRTARRDQLRVLLSRADRGVLTTAEAAILRQHVEAEMRDVDTARAVAAGNKRHVQVMYGELTAAQAAIERVQQACHDLPHECARRILAALDGTERTEESTTP